MAKGKYASQLEQRSEDRMRMWLDEGVRFCSENDIPVWIQNKLRGQWVFHDYLCELICKLNKQYNKQIKWCEIDGVIYIDEPGIGKIINYLSAYDYLPMWNAMQWAIEMEKFFKEKYE